MNVEEQRVSKPEAVASSDGKSYSPRITVLLCDLANHCASAARLVALGRQEFNDNELLRLAAEAIISRTGETVARIDRENPDFTDDHPELELRNLKDARNFVVHAYDQIDYDIVWEILERHIPRVGRMVSDKIQEI